MIAPQKIIDWLLQGDVSVQYQVQRDLLCKEIPALQERIAQEGWGKRFLEKRNPDGHWGQRFYQPKWISTHYTLLDLKNLGLDPGNKQASETLLLISKNERGIDGGINPSGSVRFSDVCINGMFLNYASYFHLEEAHLKKVVDFILSQHMADGGFNCRFNRSGAIHSSLHTTLSILEGITEYQKNNYSYRKDDLDRAKVSALEFLMLHQLFLSDRTGVIINADFLRLPYPGRWRYDILRALDYLQHEGFPWDERMQPAMTILLDKRNKDYSWNLNARYPGKVHFEMEKAGKPSRWNTLRVYRVLKKYPEFNKLV